MRVPQYWWDVANTINADTRPGKVLVLPLDDYYQMPTTWGFFGVDSIPNLLIQHPVVQPKPDGYFGDGAGFRGGRPAPSRPPCSAATSTRYRGCSTPPGSREVIVRHDLVRGLPGRTFADDRVLTRPWRRPPG